MSINEGMPWEPVQKKPCENISGEPESMEILTKMMNSTNSVTVLFPNSPYKNMSISGKLGYIGWSVWRVSAASTVDFHAGRVVGIDQDRREIYLR